MRTGLSENEPKPVLQKERGADETTGDWVSSKQTAEMLFGVCWTWTDSLWMEGELKVQLLLNSIWERDVPSAGVSVCSTS